MSYRKNVFVLGAGFSHDAGAPLMNDFFQRARDFKEDPKSSLTEADRKIFRRVVEYRFDLNKALAKIFVDLDNIEQLFGFLEMELQLSSLAQVGLRDDMRYLIARTLEVSTEKSLPVIPYGVVTGRAGETKVSRQFRGNQYAFFSGLVSGSWNPDKLAGADSIDSIITFNYDLVLEREMSALRVSPNYHCGASADYYEDAFAGSTRRVSLLKLHGSVNWVTCANCKRLYFLSPEATRVASLRDCACPKCGQFSFSTLIVPPTWNKGIEEDFIRSVWSKALEELMTARRLFIVGYSFPETDQFFKYMLGLALAQNDELWEVHIINPSEGAWEAFKRLFNPYFLERVVTYHRAYAHNFIPDIQSLTKQEFKETNLDNNFVRS